MHLGVTTVSALEAQLAKCPKWPMPGSKECRAPLREALKVARSDRKIGIPLVTDFASADKTPLIALGVVGLAALYFLRR